MGQGPCCLAAYRAGCIFERAVILVVLLRTNRVLHINFVLYELWHCRDSAHDICFARSSCVCLHFNEFVSRCFGVSEAARTLTRDDIVSLRVLTLRPDSRTCGLHTTCCISRGPMQWNRAIFDPRSWEDTRPILIKLERHFDPTSWVVSTNSQFAVRLNSLSFFFGPLARPQIAPVYRF